jgi:phosphohistidine phosphatase SixA
MGSPPYLRGMNRRSLILALPLLVLGPRLARADALAAARQPGAVLLMRHATAPGGGDPPGFRLGDCSTQRNLSAAGRAEAQAIGARLAAAGIRPTLIATSQWCRCRDTAALLDLGPVQDWPEINSFFSDRSTGPAQTAATLARLAALSADATVLLVTHQVNITALTGIVPRSGEIVVSRRTGGGLAVTGRLPPA